MSLHFDAELSDLTHKLSEMANAAAHAVDRAVEALARRDDTLARQVETDDAILDGFEKEIDDIGIHLLAKAPLASELRLITVAMKASHDLERVGDEATTIARRVLELNREPALPMADRLPPMAALGLQLLRDAIAAFIARDAQAARALIPRDKQIDALNKQVHRDLAAHILTQPTSVTGCLNLMTIAKSLERIGDHATNIAEETVFLREGEDIRHDPKAKEGGPGPT
ncbi:MAG: hypothetical protein RJA22_1844 [Verrucomicrobiota bacterium]|jgi:phosphate transport system protein